MQTVKTLLLVACFLPPAGQSGVEAMTRVTAAVQAERYGSYWYRYDAQEYYGGAWHPAGSVENPSRALVENSRRAWLEGDPSRRWASDIYTIYVP